MVIAATAGFVLCSTPALAGSFAFGVLSYDVQIPASGPQAGVNVIQIQNLTGSASLAPDFPILTGLTLSDLTLTILTPGGSQILALGALGPGSLAPNPSLQFASTIVIQSLTLAATLSPLTGISIAGSPGSYAIANPNFLYVLLPSAGEELVAGVDIGVLEAAADLTDVPEPSSWAMLLTSVAGLFAGNRIRARRRSRIL